MKKNDILYLECPHCNNKVPKFVLAPKIWRSEKKVICPECESESELSEWDWLIKHYTHVWIQVPPNSNIKYVVVSKED